jgi:chromosome segregation ATPase
MELNQILKHVEWLDDERRKDKDTIAKQEDRLITLEGNLDAAHQQIRELTGEITRLSAVVARMDRFDESLVQQRVEFNKQIEELEKQTKKRDEESEKVRRVEMRAVDSSLGEIRKELDPISGLQRGVQARIEEEHRLARLIDELRTKIQEIRRDEEEYNRTYRLLEDGRRQDSKRLVDLQGEVSAMRKRLDDQRGQTELLNANFRKVETRLNELVTVEEERRDAQSEFMDKQALLQVERDREWKEWQARFETIEKQASDVEVQLQAMDATHRNVQRSKESLEELAQKVERRINEITEMQRLGEERFRQEWVTFKADDQKRWTNYTLTQEEQRSETNRNLEKLSERITHLEDSLQEIQDLFYQINEHTEKRLQGLLAIAHEWVAAYERSLGRVR